MRRWNYVPSSRALRVVWYFVALLAIALVVLLIVSVTRQSQRLNETAANVRESKADRAQLHSALDDVAAALATANERLIDAGRSPVAEPPSVTEVPGPAGEPGATGAQGPEGETGAAGPVGRQGKPGKDGQDGATGPSGPVGADGPQGPAGPAGPEGPRGEQGPKGDQGPAGADGQGAFPFTFVFTVDTLTGSTTYTVTCVAEGCNVTTS